MKAGTTRKIEIPTREVDLPTNSPRVFGRPESVALGTLSCFTANSTATRWSTAPKHAAKQTERCRNSDYCTSFLRRATAHTFIKEAGTKKQAVEAASRRWKKLKMEKILQLAWMWPRLVLRQRRWEILKAPSRPYRPRQVPPGTRLLPGSVA
ncbi:unnamed protein product [Amoebophrya sp. A120]|nr:unnamed protein product [Amoebophrya sp. A120]|eukprot:GSA120T00005845001.1